MKRLGAVCFCRCESLQVLVEAGCLHNVRNKSERRIEKKNCFFLFNLPHLGDADKRCPAFQLVQTSNTLNTVAAWLSCRWFLLLPPAVAAATAATALDAWQMMRMGTQKNKNKKL